MFFAIFNPSLFLRLSIIEFTGKISKNPPVGNRHFHKSNRRIVTGVTPVTLLRFDLWKWRFSKFFLWLLTTGQPFIPYIKSGSLKKQGMRFMSEVNKGMYHNIVNLHYQKHPQLQIFRRIRYRAFAKTKTIPQLYLLEHYYFRKYGGKR